MNILNGFKVGSDEKEILCNIIIGLIAGAIIMAGYIFGHKDKKYSKNFSITILLLPAIMAVVIPFIATDLKKAVSLAGIFALVRFRSIPGDSKDILYVFFTLAVGVVVGLSNYIEAFALTLIVSAVFVLLQRCWPEKNLQLLKITIPEDMNFKGAFDDIFEKYLAKYSVKDVKTSNMGTLFTISYNIEPKNGIDTKAFIDEIRTRNGNLNVVISDYDGVPSL